MSTLATFAACALVIGAGATALLDLWNLARQRLRGIAPLDYALVGRWLAHLARGRLRAAPVAAAPAVYGERALGWVAHYLIGIAFAAALLAGAGPAWVCRPTLAPALAVGVGSVLAPLLVLHPALGLGVFARRAPRPGAVRLRSLQTHAVFGFGLYAAGWLARATLAGALAHCAP